VREKPYRVGLIGVGTIAEMRAPALQAAGLKLVAVSSRPESTRVRSFAERHGGARVFDDWRSMLDEPGLFDALAISTWPDGTPAVLRAACDLGIPTIVEKPVAWNTTTLRALCAMPHENVIVGYNRRFYRSVQMAHQAVQSGGPLIASLVLPTDVVAPATPDPSGRYMQQFYESVSALGLDLTRFVLGDLTVESAHRLRNAAGNIAAIAATLATARGDLVQVTCNWGTSANYSLTLSRPGRRVELLPFEIATIYEGMAVEPPSPEYPIRRYLPKVVDRLVLEGVDLKEKPGFVGEAQALISMIEGCPPPAFTARLEDALAVTTLCEQLTGVQLGDINPSTYH
jgi:predicted dehydrogenase